MSAVTEIPEEARPAIAAAPRRLAQRLAAHLRTPVACLCYMAVLVGAGVGVDHLIAGRLFSHPNDFVPAYRSYPEYAVGSKLHQFEATKTRWSSLFIGNSRTMFDVDPTTVDSALAAKGDRQRSYNLAFPSIDPRFWPWLFQHDYDRPLPKHVFLGILTRDLDARFNSSRKFTSEFQASQGFAHRNMSPTNSRAEEALSRVFILRGRAAD